MTPLKACILLTGSIQTASAFGALGGWGGSGLGWRSGVLPSPSPGNAVGAGFSRPTLFGRESTAGRPDVALRLNLDRHHNFADIGRGKIDALFDKIDELGISLSDVDEKFVRGSGAGGQKINKTSSNVQMTHQPTGLQVSCQREREREKNRFIALRSLVEKIEAEATGKKAGSAAADIAAQKAKKNKARAKRRRMAKVATGGGEGEDGEDGEDGEEGGDEGAVEGGDDEDEAVDRR